MSAGFTDRLDRCIAGLDARQQQQNAEAVRAYARRIERRLERVTTLILQRRQLPATTADPLERWAARICSMISKESLRTCDPRLEQSLDDLLLVMSDDLASLIRT